MIEPITYLYYRCYKLYSHFDNENPALEYGILFGMLMFLIINGAAALFVVDRITATLVFGLSLFGLMLLVFLLSLFEKRIVMKYDALSENWKVIGHVVFAVEILLAVGSVVSLVNRPYVSLIVG